MTEEEYLEFDRNADYRSEFVRGEMYAMAGGSIRHSRATMNFGAALWIQLASRDCAAFSSDTRIRTAHTSDYVYADISVVCGKPEIVGNAADILLNPKVIVEVQSPSTSDYDHGTRFELYREIVSLSDYIMVHITVPFVEHYTRQSDSKWILQEYRDINTAVSIPSIGCEIPLEQIYRGVFELPAPEEAPKRPRPANP